MKMQTLQVLVVDGESESRQEIAACLLELGCKVKLASEAREALDFLGSGEFQVVVTELELADCDGPAFIAQLSTLHPEIDIVVTSRITDVEFAAQLLRQGAQDLLPKPFSSRTLNSVLGRCLSIRRLSEENSGSRDLIKLLEDGRRVASATELAQMADALLTAALVHTQASAGFCVAEGSRGFSVLRSAGLSEEESALLKDVDFEPILRVGKQVFEGGARVAVEEEGVDAAGASLPSSVFRCERELLIFPFPERLSDSGAAHPTGGLVLLGYGSSKEGRRQGELKAGLDFLCRSAAVALANFRRFDSMSQLAYRDDLTGLFNARYLRMAVERELEKERTHFALIFLDLDRFKEVNDTRGHLEGSRVLVELAEVLRASVRDSDVCTRYGGDEFCVVLPHTTGPEALNVAERIRRGIAKHRFADEHGEAIRLTASLGVAIYPKHGRTWEELLESADRAMYRGKRDSQDVVVLAGEDGGVVKDRKSS